jgi:hypothetical protein
LRPEKTWKSFNEMGLVEVAATCREIRHADAMPFAHSVQRIPDRRTRQKSFGVRPTSSRKIWMNWRALKPVQCVTSPTVFMRDSLELLQRIRNGRMPVGRVHGEQRIFHDAELFGGSRCLEQLLAEARRAAAPEAIQRHVQILHSITGGPQERCRSPAFEADSGGRLQRCRVDYKRFGAGSSGDERRLFLPIVEEVVGLEVDDDLDGTIGKKALASVWNVVAFAIPEQIDETESGGTGRCQVKHPSPSPILCSGAARNTISLTGLSTPGHDPGNLFDADLV